MTRWVGILGWLLAFQAHLSYQISTPEDNDYGAAVVEFSPNRHKDAAATINDNTAEYLRYIAEAVKANADIIVFPEDGLTTMRFPVKAEMDPWTTFIPAPSDNYTPCTQDTVPVSKALKTISCAAKDHRIYVVINIAEKVEKCTDDGCTERESIYHNTNVVFDRTGKIIARYRKTNLFDEEQFSVTDVPEIATFETDFGVKFGMFICFDILFHTPALNLTRQHGVTDIVYSTAWFSELPFLTAVQTQYGWAYSEKVNLLAAGYNQPQSMTTGSGIYLGRNGIADAIFAQNEGSQLLVRRVPKVGRTVAAEEKKDDSAAPKKELSSASWDDVIFHLQDNITLFNSVIVDAPLEKEICQNGFCCTFKVNAASFDPAVKYRIAVFNGLRHYGREAQGAVQVCGLIQCADESVESCTSTKRSETIFSQLEITSTFHEYQDNLVMPSTLDSSILPITSFSYEEHKHNDHAHITMLLDGPTKDIVTFGLYGRIITKDATSPANNIIPKLPTLLSVALSLLLV